MWNRIRDNDKTTIWVEGQFAVQPDATTRFIVLYPEPVAEVPGSHIDSSTIDTLATLTVQIPNDRLQSLAVGVFMVGADGQESYRHLTQLREFYAYGASSPATSPGYVTVGPDALGNITIDLNRGRNFRLILGSPAPKFLLPSSTGSPIAAGDELYIYVDDLVGSQGKPNWETGVAGGYAADVLNVNIDPTPNTRTTFLFTYHGSAWCLDQDPRVGGAIT